LVDRSGVTGDLAQAGVASDGRNLVRGAACLSQPASGGLAQPVGAAAVQASGSTLVAKPIAKASRAVGLAVVCDEKCQVAGGRFGDDRCQGLMNRNPEFASFTTGDSDFLLISECNDAENIIASLLAAAAAGTISDVTTARAWTGAEFKAIADKASKAQKAYRVPGKK
jgi:hypothetical protein